MKQKGLGFVAVKPNLSGSCLTNPHSERAFTLTELVVVLATIVILGGLLLPALAATHDRSNRAVCQDHLRQIGVAITQYAGENDGGLVSAQPDYSGGPDVSVMISANSSSNLTQIGLDASESNRFGGLIWTCPNRPGLPLDIPYYSFWVIGYEYFGGFTDWDVPGYGMLPSRSPTNLQQARPYWALAADANVWDGTAWGDLIAPTPPQPNYYSNIPPHRTSDASFPQGGNEVFCDGSVQWIPFEKMYRLTSWPGNSGTRYCDFYQNPVDFGPTITPSMLRNLQARP